MRPMHFKIRLAFIASQIFFFLQFRKILITMNVLKQVKALKIGETYTKTVKLIGRWEYSCKVEKLEDNRIYYEECYSIDA